MEVKKFTTVKKICQRIDKAGSVVQRQPGSAWCFINFNKFCFNRRFFIKQ